jgi:hypothetical protein
MRLEEESAALEPGRAQNAVEAAFVRGMFLYVWCEVCAECT